MKTKFISLIAAAALTGCVSAPQSADEMRAASGSMFGQHSVQKVNRSYGAVVASLRAGASKCMNRNQQVRQQYRPAPNMAPTLHTFNFYYSTTVRNAGNRTEMSMRKKVGGAKLIGGGSDNSGIAYLVDVSPASGGTKLDIYGGKIGYGDLNKAVLAWANGAPIRCPELP